MPLSSLQRNIKPPKNFRYIMHSPIVFFASILILLILGRGAIATFLKDRETAKVAKSAEQRLTELKNRNDELNRRIDYLKTPEGEETELRSLYNAVKPGETVVLVVDSKIAPTTTPKTKSFWQKFVAFLNE